MSDSRTEVVVSSTESGERNQIRVFISYSHDSEAHKARVLDLATRLQTDGVSAAIDQQAPPGPPGGWLNWMTEQVENSDFVLAVCTRNYGNSFRGGAGATGVRWEATLSIQVLSETLDTVPNVIPILFEDGDIRDVPLPLRSFTRYVLPRDYGALLSRLRTESGPEGARDHAVELGLAARPDAQADSRVVDALRTDLQVVFADPIAGDGCSWQLKESQVLLGDISPAVAGYYPVLVGNQLLQRVDTPAAHRIRNRILSWSLSAPFFNERTDWFEIKRQARPDPAEPPLLDIRHTAEVGLVLLMSNSAPARTKHIVMNIVKEQHQGGWKSNGASEHPDPLSSCICAELVAGAIDKYPEERATLTRALGAALDYFGGTKCSKGWRYEGLDNPMWEVWGASIIGFRLGSWLPDALSCFVRDSISEELKATDLLLSGLEPRQRARLLIRYLCALRVVGYDPDCLDSWCWHAAGLWRELAPTERDMSTRLHLAHLFLDELWIHAGPTSMELSND